MDAPGLIEIKRSWYAGFGKSLAPASVIAALRTRFAHLDPDGASAVPIHTSRD